MNYLWSPDFQTHEIPPNKRNLAMGGLGRMDGLPNLRPEALTAIRQVGILVGLLQRWSQDLTPAFLFWENSRKVQRFGI